MQRISLTVCVLLAGGLAMAAGCKSNLRVDHMDVQRITATPKVGVHVRIENAGSRDAKGPFQVLFRNQTTGASTTVPFAQGLKRHQSRLIKAQLHAAVGEMITVRVDPDDYVNESDEHDNAHKKPAPP